MRGNNSVCLVELLRGFDGLIMKTLKTVADMWTAQ